MIPFEKALETVLRQARPTGTERIPFQESLHRILAEDVYSDVDMPPFDKAAMDGYACRRSDLGEELRVVEVVAAGQLPTKKTGPGECTRIMTGAMVPEGADTVIMVEHTEATGRDRIRFTGEKTAPNIARKGEDVRTGDLVWERGMPVMPRHIGMLAATGCVRPLVARRVRVGILSTGDELVEPETLPPPGKIRNTNGFQLTAQVRAMHCIPHYMGIIPDDEKATERALSKALAENDVVVLSGGVSMGDYDFVPEIMKKTGVEILFRKVAVKPGRPTVFGRTDRSVVFGLPGNPVSSFINFEVFVKPLLYAMMGHDFQPPVHRLPLGTGFSRRKADRLEFVPVRMEDGGQVVPVTYHGSAHLQAICLATGIMAIPIGVSDIQKGTPVDVRPL
jgi:molybdopterin molybdotransferase